MSTEHDRSKSSLPRNQQQSHRVRSFGVHLAAPTGSFVGSRYVSAKADQMSAKPNVSHINSKHNWLRQKLEAAQRRSSLRELKSANVSGILNRTAASLYEQQKLTLPRHHQTQEELRNKIAEHTAKREAELRSKLAEHAARRKRFISEVRHKLRTRLAKNEQNRPFRDLPRTGFKFVDPEEVERRVRSAQMQREELAQQLMRMAERKGGGSQPQVHWNELKSPKIAQKLYKTAAGNRDNLFRKTKTPE